MYENRFLPKGEDAFPENTPAGEAYIRCAGSMTKRIKTAIHGCCAKMAQKKTNASEMLNALDNVRARLYESGEQHASGVIQEALTLHGIVRNGTRWIYLRNGEEPTRLEAEHFIHEALCETIRTLRDGPKWQRNRNTETENNKRRRETNAQQRF